jgi:ATP-dependent Clp protease protease subunit
MADERPDLSALLLKQRIILLSGPIDDAAANAIAAQLLVLRRESASEPIQLHINSPGGSVIAALAIYDALRLVTSEVATHVIGQAAGTALLIACAGTPGQRHAAEHARFAFGEARATADTLPQLEELARLQARFRELLAKHTGQTLERIANDWRQGTRLSAEEAKAFGLVDRVEPGKKR